MGKLDGRVAVITAAGSGIGRACALALASHGAKVLVTDLRLDAAVKVSDEIVARGGGAMAMMVDVEQPALIAAMIDRVLADFGRIDILHNNAAMMHPDYMRRDSGLLSLDVEAWDRIMAINLRSVFLACQAAIPHMITQGGGVIINTASTVGMLADMETPAYGASKAGIIRLSAHIATEFGKQNIRSNVVAPGVVRTQIVEDTFPPQLFNAHLDAAMTPYLPEAEDVANVVAFLASDEARGVTGHVIPVDGGTTAHLPTVQDTRRFYQQTAKN